LIVVDSSPLVAILLQEIDADQYKDAIRRAGELCIAAPKKLEVMMVAAVEWARMALNWRKN
jgi:uncharacterized protein with PIN domain